MPRYLTLLTLSGAVAVAGLLYVVVSHLNGEGGTTAAAPAATIPADFHEPLPQLFAPTSVWNTQLATDAPIDPGSNAMVAGLSREVAREEVSDVGPWIATRRCSTPLYVVPAGQPELAVHLTQPRIFWRRSLAKVFEHVPLPADARPADCVDRHLTVWQPSTDRLWEFFHLRHDPESGWWADWGGAMQHVSSSPGYYTSESWPGLSAPNWGATATSLPVLGGVILLSELRAERINHALALNLPIARAGVFSWPAQRSDGLGGPERIPEGARLRLPHDLNLTALNLPPVTLTMARAVRRYGAIVRDQTGPGNGVSFFAEDARPVGSNPYDGKDGLFAGVPPDLLLADFPWEKLEVLKMTLCVKAPCPES
ncbi:MAG TPA: hypothetical protein VIM28_07885 [Solirubrobacterales bacterium]